MEGLTTFLAGMSLISVVPGSIALYLVFRWKDKITGFLGTGAIGSIISWPLLWAVYAILQFILVLVASQIILRGTF